MHELRRLSPELTRWKYLSYLQAGVGVEAFSMATLVLFYVDHVGFSFETFSTFIASVFVLLCLFEIPAGAIADRFGRKRCLVIGNSLYVCAMAGLLASKNSDHWPVIALAFAAGGALASGTFQSMMFEQFAARNASAQFHAVMAKSTGIGLWSGAIAALLGGVMASVSLALPLTLDAVALGMLTLILWWRVPSVASSDGGYAAHDRHLNTKAACVEKRPPPKIGTLLSVACQTFVHSREWCLLVIAAALTFTGVRASFNLYQPLMLNADIDVKWLGVVFGVLVLAGGICARLFSRMPKRWLDRGLPEIVIAALFVLSTVLAAFDTSNVASLVGCIAAHQFVRGAFPSYYSYRLNQAIGPSHTARATLLSTAQWARRLSSGVTIFAIGQFATMSDLSTSFVLLNGAIASSLTLVYCLHYPLRRARIAKHISG